MSLLWPGMLWLAVLLPGLVPLYLWLVRRRKQAALRYPNLAVVGMAMTREGAWRRHLPPALLFGAVSVLLFAGARPSAPLPHPSNHQTIILAMDVSGSMRAGDVTPSRMVASQAAARKFSEQLPGSVRIGVVAYGDSAHLVQRPTRSRRDIADAIDRFQVQGATAIGRGILASLEALYPREEFDLDKASRRRSHPSSSMADSRLRTRLPDLGRVAPGSDESAVIVLLTDGENTSGPSPIEAAQLAAERGVKIFTVGFGKPGGTFLNLEGTSVRVRLDEATMKSIAAMTGGTYYHADSGSDLMKIYDSLKARLVLADEDVEITAFFALGGAFLVLLSAGLSIAWFGRVA